MSSTSTEQLSKISSRPQVVKVDKAFKLAQLWVNNMTKSTEDESTVQVDLEARPLRLGLGAAVPRQTQVTLSNDPVERKLQLKLNAEKRKVDRNKEELRKVDEESDEEENESITKREFVKKRPLNMALKKQQPKKKH